MVCVYMCQAERQRSCGVGWTGCDDCVHPVCACGCVRLEYNSIGAKGCAALADALVHVPSLTTLEYVGCGVCGGYVGWSAVQVWQGV